MNGLKSDFLQFPLISQPATSPRCVYTGSDSNTAASLLTKRFTSVENNKTLNRRRAGEPYVARSLFSQNGFASYSPKGA